MKTGNYLSQLDGSRFQMRIWMLAFFISLVVNAGMVAVLLTKKDTIRSTFITPNINQPFTYTDGRFSSSYVEQVATWFLSQTLNYNPASFEYQMSTFLKHVDPSLFAQLKQTLVKELEDIRKQRRSSIFFPQRVHVRGLKAIVIGYRQIRIGSTATSDEKEQWYIQLTQRTDGLVTLADIKKVSEVDAAKFIKG